MNRKGILIHRIFFPVSVLGPGPERLGIWTQGCTIHCPGCMTPESWMFDAKFFLSFKKLESIIKEYMIVGVSSAVISGGEPFDQPNGLLSLLKILRSYKFNDILVFSGYDFDTICTKYEKHLKFVDIIISEPFILSDSNVLNWRGSDNQKIHVFNPKLGYNESYLNNMFFSENRELQIVKRDNTVFLIGIPKRGDIQRIKDII